MSQNHPWMSLDRFKGDGFLVLARNCQQDSPFRESFQCSLEIHESLSNRVVAAESEILPSHITHYSTPKRVVEVDDYYLPCLSSGRGQDRGYVFRSCIENLILKEGFGTVP